MDAYRLPISQTIQDSWDQVKGCKSHFWAAYGWIAVFAFIFGLITALLDYPEIMALTIISFIIKPIFSFITTLLGFGVLRMGILRAKKAELTASMIFVTLKSKKLILKLLGYWALYFAILVPLVLISVCSLVYAFSGINSFSLGCIIAAFIGGVVSICTIYFMVRARLGWAFILDKDLSPWPALKMSFYITYHNVWRLIGLYCINALILIISAIPLGIGLIWSLPYMLINYGMVFKKLSDGRKI